MADEITRAARGKHPAVPKLLRAYRAGRMTRREFLATVTTLGLAAPIARGLAGPPARAQDGPAGEASGLTAGPVAGGRLRISMAVMEIADPRLYDWPQKGNVARGTLEPLVRQDVDSALVPWLLEGWETNADASEHLLRLRPGVYWTNGDAFTAEDVIANLNRWAEAHVPGNSMATRIASLIEPKRVETRRVLMMRDNREIEDEVEVVITGLIDGAVERVDAMTVRLRPGRPDITLIPGFSDYPALIVHRDFDANGGDLTTAPVGTGPWVIDAVRVGESAALSRRRDLNGWWGDAVFGPVALDGIDYIDYGTDPARDLAAFAAGEIDANYETTPSYVAEIDEAGLVRAAVRTTNTVCVRMRVDQPPFDSQPVRNAVQRAVDNAVVLELGQQGFGTIGENHHVAPMHRDYAAIPPVPPDPERALAMLREAGAAETELELVSSDADVPRNTCDAVAAQLRDAGVKVRRVILPTPAFWQDWRRFPFSATEWISRPLAAQTYVLAYRSDAPWNETSFADPRFDALLDRSLALIDPEARRPLMAEMETLLRDSGVLIQAFWRDTFRHMTDRVRGLGMHPTYELHLERVWLVPEDEPK